jgi:ribonuclease Z
LEIKFIGTSSGKVSLHRYHSSFIILSERFNLLVDAGDGISKALLASNIKFDQIDGILFSHLHPDHYSGIGALIVQMKLVNRTKVLRIFIHKDLSSTLKNYIYSSYLFNERMDFEIRYEEFEHNQDVRVSDEINFISRQNSHLDQYLKYDKQKKLNFICSSFLLKLKNKNVFFTGDMGSPDDLYLFRDCIVQMLICETTHLEMQALMNAVDDLGINEVFLIHFDDETQSDLEVWKNSLSEKIRNIFIVAYDDLSVPI